MFSLFSCCEWLLLGLFILLICYLCFFFFSSRRRHTRCLSDWSSDVCSSDLLLAFLVDAEDADMADMVMAAGIDAAGDVDEQLADIVLALEIGEALGDALRRSEERRVGKECRSRWSAYH